MALSNFERVMSDSQLRSAILNRLDPSTALAAIQKSEAQRFTLAPVYVPGRLDHDNDWTDAETLQQAAWEYMKSSRQVRLQHTHEVAGELLEIVSWPHEVTTILKTADGTAKEVILPPGTVYAGIRWTPKAWTALLAGEINGLSLSGRAERIEVEVRHD